ncbi:MAG: hypothetical protein Q4G68_11610 [Planctomycetia bacterium]|nr:hypothetical protein [Planctomycetia bacterium]
MNKLKQYKPGIIRMATLIALLVLTTAPLGCNKGPYDIVPVKGVILYNGEPLANCSVEFRPVTGRPSTAKTDEMGCFEAYYTVDAKGIQVGEVHLFLTDLDGKQDPKNPGLLIYTKEQQEIMKKYGHTTTGFPLTITKKENNLQIDLQ